jgi:hypothetical protein
LATTAPRAITMTSNISFFMPVLLGTEVTGEL